jgi:hypothetical protein
MLFKQLNMVALDRKAFASTSDFPRSDFLANCGGPFQRLVHEEVCGILNRIGSWNPGGGKKTPWGRS